MDKIKILVLGLGNFGHSWATWVVPSCSDCANLVGVVEKRTDRWQGVWEGIPKFKDLATALEETKPDLVINVTPPDVHCELSAMILRKNIAVLCEKPIADNYENAVTMGNVLKETNGFLMIGENYRYYPVFREAKKILQTSNLGKIHQVQCSFRHYHADYSMFYHGALEHPLIEDVTIHHLDLARYLSDKEPVSVWCKEFAAEYSWYGERPASAVMVTEMTDNVMFHYNGTLASPVSSTNWNGNWEIECDYGVLKIENNKIMILRGENETETFETEWVDDSRVIMLREACRALKEKRKAETDFEDNFKSFHWMKKAILSSEKQQWVVVNDERK